MLISEKVNLLSSILANEYIYIVLLMALTAIPVGFVAGLFGIGGGLITVPFLYYIFGELGIDQSYIMHLAVGTSFSIIIPTYNEFENIENITVSNVELTNEATHRKSDGSDKLMDNSDRTGKDDRFGILVLRFGDGRDISNINIKNVKISNIYLSLIHI